MSNSYEVFASTINGFMYMDTSFQCKLMPFWKQHHFPPVCGVVFQPAEASGKSSCDKYVKVLLVLLGVYGVYIGSKYFGKMENIRDFFRNLSTFACMKGNDEPPPGEPPKQMKWLLPHELYERQFIPELLRQLKGKCEKHKKIKITIEELPASECLAQQDQGLLLFPVINASRVGTDVQTAFDSTRTQDPTGVHDEHTQAVVVVFKSHAPHVTPFPNTQEKLFEMRSQVLGFVDVVFHQNKIYDHEANDAAIDKLFELSKGPKEQ